MAVNAHHPQQKKPNCFGCLHFYVTHESAHPYGCRAMGFKSLQLPTMAVYASSGLACQLFAPKEEPKASLSRKI